MKRTGLMFGPYLSLTVFGWMYGIAAAIVLGYFAYDRGQSQSQTRMLEAVQKADVLAEFCSGEPGLFDQACRIKSRAQEPSDQLLWSLMVEAGVLDPRDVASPIEFQTPNQLPQETAAMVKYLKEVLPLDLTGLELFRHVTRVCTGEGLSEDVENGILLAMALMLAETYPEERTFNAFDDGNGRNQSLPFSDARIITLANEEIFEELSRKPFSGLKSRISVYRGISDAEIVSALFAVSGNTLAPPYESEFSRTPSYNFDENCDEFSADIDDDEQRFRYLEARGELAMFLAGRIRTSEGVKAARYRMTLVTGPEQFALMVVFAFGVLLGIQRVLFTLVIWLRKVPVLPGNLGEDEREPDFRAQPGYLLEQEKSQVIKKLVSARWPLKTAAALLPALGFVGTVRGIMNSLSGADQIVWATTVNERSAAISALSADLGLAFATTLLALLGGLVLTLIVAMDGRLVDLVVLRRFDAALDDARKQEAS